MNRQKMPKKKFTEQEIRDFVTLAIQLSYIYDRESRKFLLRQFNPL